MRKTIKRGTLLLALLAMNLFLVSCGNENAGRVIKAVSYDGTVSYLRDEKSADVYENMNFEPLDEVTTASKSNLLMQLDTDKFVYMCADTKVSMEYDGNDIDGMTNIVLNSGEIYNEVNLPIGTSSSYQIRTSNVTIGLRGTKLYTKYDGNKTIVYCKEGVIFIEAANNSLYICEEEAAVVENDTVSPVDPVDIESELELDVFDATQSGLWTTPVTALGSMPTEVGDSVKNANVGASYNLTTKLQMKYYTGIKMDGDIEDSASTQDNAFGVDANGNPYSIETTYNSEGKFKYCYRRVNGKITAFGRYSYDEAGRFSTYVSYDDKGNITNEVRVLKYNDEGLMTETVWFEYVDGVRESEENSYVQPYEYK